ncbi:hypothetical protein [Chondromyces crocatus]|uniref:Uncharacterized protein n=1 Tax=Chondromyces crocatus TaxID=52 RepID=A0A0K1EA17_CHOCO|nr:hypothetical protein [Chondromyces crocatus]AKT37527.1 uncharacterized protein CMC5_016680 [Chondromyces crocatus]
MRISEEQVETLRQEGSSGPQAGTQAPGVVEPCPEPTFRENVILIGSEMQYDSFWLKMMFIAAGYRLALSNTYRQGDRKTIAYVDVGYVRPEKLPLETLKDQYGYRLVVLNSSADVVKLFNDRPRIEVGGRSGKLLLHYVAFFCHGVPGKIALNYNASPAVDVTESQVSAMNADIFDPQGRITSYACRTGNSTLWESFNNDAEAKPEASLAQKMADRFKVSVFAYLKRTFYGNVLRDPSDSEKISSALKEARKTQEGSIIDIPDEHEALPHPGLAAGGVFGFGSATVKEGTNGYALWRKGGGRTLPTAAETPKGLSGNLREFKPRGS